MAAVSKVLGFGQFTLRLLQVCASAIVLGIFSYFLAVLADHDVHIAPWLIAVEVISGAATLYSIASSICLPLSRKGFFGGLAMAFDLVFAVGCIAIAIMARQGAASCSGHVKTPLGDGDANDQAAGFGDDGFGTGDGQQITYKAGLGLACRLQKAAFAVAMIGIFLFVVSIVTQRLYTVQHRDGRQSPPGPQKPFVDTSKRRWRFWPSRNQKPPTTGRNASAVDYYADEHSVGSIPLSDQPSTAKPPRYTRIFGWGKKRDDENVPETHTSADNKTWNPSTANDADRYGNYPAGDHGTGYGYGYVHGYRGPQPSYSSPHESPYSGGWAGDAGYATYDHGRSGVDDSLSPYAHGYGESPYQTNF